MAKHIPDDVLDINRRAGEAVARWKKAATKEEREAAAAEAKALIEEGEAILKRPFWRRWYYLLSSGRPAFGQVYDVGSRGGVYGRTHYRTRPPSRPHSINWWF